MHARFHELQVSSVMALGVVAIGVLLGVGSESDAARAVRQPLAPMAFSAGEAGDDEIFVSPDGRSRPVQITHNALADHAPAFSPSGTWIAFASGREGRESIVTARLDGSGTRSLPGSGDSYGELAWSPDGLQIACSRWDGSEWKLAVVSLRGRPQRTLATGFAPAWTTGGARLLFGAFERSGGVRVFVIDANGAGRKALTPVLARSFYRIDWFDLALSPDGRRVAFSIGGARDASQIYVMAADGKGLRRLPVHGSEPAWSPDGKQLAFVVEGGIRIADGDGGNIRTLTRGTASWGAAYPQWSPTGDEIAFVYLGTGAHRGVGITATARGRPRLLFKAPTIEWQSFTWFHRG